MRTIVALMTVALCGGVSLGQEAKPQVWDFEDAKAGALPPGWTAAKTGQGEGSVWKVVEDNSSPSGAKVLAQVAAGPGDRKSTRLNSSHIQKSRMPSSA